MRRAIVSVGLLVSATLGAQTLQSGQSTGASGRARWAGRSTRSGAADRSV